MVGRLLERIWKEAVVVFVKVLSQNLLGVKTSEATIESGTTRMKVNGKVVPVLNEVPRHEDILRLIN
jgi:hypothetical protein